MCPAYVAGLIGPGDRKSIQPMAARCDNEVSYDRLHHFSAAGVWDEAPLEAALLAEADKRIGGDDASLIIDDTALPKKGNHSVGVAPQYARHRARMPTAGLSDIGLLDADRWRSAAHGRLAPLPFACVPPMD